MGRIKYVYRVGVGLVEVERDGVSVSGSAVQDVKGVNIIKDRMRPLLHPCTGQMIDSKSRFRKITKAHGCVEVGGSFAEHKKQRDNYVKQINTQERRRTKQELIRRFNG